MPLEQGNGLQDWELAVTRKLIGGFRRRWRSAHRLDFDDLRQERLLYSLEVRRYACLLPIYLRPGRSRSLNRAFPMG
jgi:hypothetical protein